MIRRALILAFVLALGATGVAHAQGPAYSASPPTKGAWYSDGQTGRYLLGERGCTALTSRRRLSPGVVAERRLD